MRLRDHKEEHQFEFEDILDEADENASTDREESFVADMRFRFDEYGADAFVSPAQMKWLLSLAGRYDSVAEVYEEDDNDYDYDNDYDMEY